MSDVTLKWYTNSHLKGVSLRALNTRDVSNHTNLKGDAMNNDNPETVLIPLTQGQETIVDAIDADLAELKWFALYQRCYADGGKYTAGHNTPRSNGKQTTELMHRVILSRILGRPLLRRERVDHEDLNPLNNRRENLRLASGSQNQMNTRKPITNTSGVKGVRWHKRQQKWTASITVNKKPEWLGSFNTIEEAREAYKKAANEKFGKFARFE